ncbi:MAG: M14 family metallopeptidase [Planctomycetota bacterium]|nr:M14 family metallopeptidase [Planctomycetota bacterium]
MPRFLVGTLAASLALGAAAQELPQTVPESSDYARTSKAADVAEFLEKLTELPHSDRLQTRVAGKSHEDRDLLLVRAALPGIEEEAAIRLLVIANIHAGEVEGKEAVQELAREIATGEHGDLLQHAVLYIVPIYNVDGNERINARNRRQQNGPEAVGQRANAQGFDLNRDFIKAEAPETRTLLRLMRDLDPHVFMDLHTTDGSWHGYHLTYAPSLSPNQDTEIATLSRRLLDETTESLNRGEPSFQIFDYGNFQTRDWDGGGAPESIKGRRGWWTYDHRPRYGINYFGLRNRIGVLSEAYSNCDFATRIAVTKAFVLGILRAATTHKEAIKATCAAADQRVALPQTPLEFGFETRFAAPEMLPVLVGDCERVPYPDGRGARFVRKAVATPETMPVFRRFQSDQRRPLPVGWALPDPSPSVLQTLQHHGIESEILQAPRKVTVEEFAVDKKRKPKRPYQGHQELFLTGSWAAPRPHELAAGTLWVPATQPLGRLCAQLLEPESEDSLSSWNFLEDQTGSRYPVLRVLER